MNNEDTIIMQPGKGKAGETQNKSAQEAGKKSNTAKQLAATAGASMFGSAVGAGGVYAATTLHDAEEEELEEQTAEQEEEQTAEAQEEQTAEQEEESVAAAAAEPKEETHSQPKPEPTAAATSASSHEGPDYTGHNGANPVTPNPEVRQAANEEEDSDGPEVLGMRQIEGEDGQTMEAVMLTNDGEVAVVVDTDGDGKADVLAVDENHNMQFEDSEIHDVSGDNWNMEGYRQSLAQNNPELQQAEAQDAHSTAANDSGTGDEVQVLGVYQAEGENGQTMEAAVLTDGQEVAAVVDVDGDGYADAFIADVNHNQQIDEGEVYDVSDEQVHMSGFEQSYLAQQEQAQMEDTPETFAYNVDDQQDYTNDVDPTFV